MAKKAVWQNRIVGHADVDPQTLTANPLNFRRHPKAQAEATTGSLNELGWVQDVLVNKTTGRVDCARQVCGIERSGRAACAGHA
jgi:hypothetical protein